MSQPNPGAQTPSDAAYTPPQPQRQSLGFNGVVSAFAGVLLLMSATFSLLQGLSAVAKDDIYVSGQDYLYQFDVTTWGWIQIVIGVLCAAVAIGILANQSWGQVTGIIIAGISAVVNFAFIPQAPLWAIVIIAVDLLIIHALATQLADD